MSLIRRPQLLRLGHKSVLFLLLLIAGRTPVYWHRVFVFCKANAAEKPVLLIVVTTKV
jgi:hypothetical protein